MPTPKLIILQAQEKATTLKIDNENNAILGLTLDTSIIP